MTPSTQPSQELCGRKHLDNKHFCAGRNKNSPCSDPWKGVLKRFQTVWKMSSTSRTRDWRRPHLLWWSVLTESAPGALPDMLLPQLQVSASVQFRAPGTLNCQGCWRWYGGSEMNLIFSLSSLSPPWEPWGFYHFLDLCVLSSHPTPPLGVKFQSNPLNTFPAIPRAEPSSTDAQ